MPPILGYHLIFHKILKIFSSKSVFSLLLFFSKVQQKIFTNFLSRFHENISNTQGTMKKESQRLLIRGVPFITEKINFLHSSL